MRSALKIGWLGLMICALIFAIAAHGHREMDIAVTYFMLLLTFPAGHLFAVAVALLSTNERYLPGGLAGVLITWPFFVLFGYVQWFIVLPTIYRRFSKKSHEAEKAEPHI